MPLARPKSHGRVGAAPALHWGVPSALRSSAPAAPSRGSRSKASTTSGTVTGSTSVSLLTRSSSSPCAAAKPRLAEPPKPRVWAFTSTTAPGKRARTASAVPSRLPSSTTTSSAPCAASGATVSRQRRVKARVSRVGTTRDRCFGATPG